ncbi:MAG: TraR/DksA family transcriptional regulator [Spirochaetes bacterium]|nr:TraR/DksA family transcriptional regulator [Spirochaetota bacterium]
MRKRTLESIEKKLIQKKQQILETIEGELANEIEGVESETITGDIVDEANSSYEHLIYSSLTVKEQEKLSEINEALNRLNEGIFGRCVVCGKPIDEKRLRAIPEAKMCIACKAKQERRKN